MERTITYEGERWQVWVNPAPAGRDSQSGLDLVFRREAGDRRVASPMSRPLLRTLSREGLELDESLLREELRRALHDAPDSDLAQAGEHGGEDGER